jgi:predicted type IV restriction endonuclease
VIDVFTVIQRHTAQRVIAGEGEAAVLLLIVCIRQIYIDVNNVTKTYQRKEGIKPLTITKSGSTSISKIFNTKCCRIVNHIFNICANPAWNG